MGVNDTVMLLYFITEDELVFFNLWKRLSAVIYKK
jgi:hypothetical protein